MVFVVPSDKVSKTFTFETVIPLVKIVAMYLNLLVSAGSPRWAAEAMYFPEYFVVAVL